MKRFKCLAPMAALVMASPAMAQNVFSENFDDGSAATRWSAPVIEAETGVFDGQVDFAFDYGAIGIPAAPGGGGSTGILFEVNTTDQGGDQGEAVGIVPLAFDLPNVPAYRYVVDAYFNVENQSEGTTEFALLGVNAADFVAPGDAGLNDDLPFDFGISNGNGLTYHASGDSGAFNDFHRYEDAGNAGTGSQTGLGGYDAREAANPSLFPNIDDPAGLGPQEQWINLAIQRVDDEVSFFVDGALIDTFDAAAFTGGTILLGYADYFNSVGTTGLEAGPDPTPNNPIDNGPFGDEIAGFAHFVVFDNVRVDVIPEPTSAALGLLAMVGLAARRRG